MLNTKDVISESGIQFGTSGARGLVTQFTGHTCAAFTHAFLSGIDSQFTFKQVAVAIDNRPSSQQMAQYIVQAINDHGYEAIYYGVIPTPALAYSAMQDSMPCIMVTGSHIPFDRNGLKFYTPLGEITKADEQAILDAEYHFEYTGLSCLESCMKAEQVYLERYCSLFDKSLLTGKRIGIYEHSSAGRDIYGKLFESLGAQVISLERSDDFVPIDTEAVSQEDQNKAIAWVQEHSLDAIFSTDGDGDRPLLSDENGVWLRGDILGLICAELMGVEALCVPVSCNTVIESCGNFMHVTRTKIGSPYVIAEFKSLKKKYGSVAGFEANGGFLLGSDLNFNGKMISELPTRDAVLPALMVLSSNKKISELVNALPQRFTYSDRIQNFATKISQSIIETSKENPSKLLKQLEVYGVVVKQNNVDGLRLELDSGNIIHLRPSGNAPELRCYVESDSYETAKSLVAQILKRIQQIDL